MANNVFQVKRTNTSGRTPNTTGSYATNTQYIAAGEFALNMADGILYSSNGSAVIEVGANNTTARVTNTLIVASATTVNSIGVTTTGFVNATGVVSGLELTSTLASGDEGGQINLTKPPNGTTNGNVIIDAYQNRIRIYEAGSPNRGAYIDLTAAANGVASNLLTGGGGGGGTVTSVGSGDGLTGGPITGSGTLSVLANNGISANSTGVFAVAGLGTVVNSTGINVNANNGLTATAAGVFVTGNSGLTVNSTGVHVLANTGIVANSTGTFVNATYIGTISANNASFLGGTAAAAYVQNTDSRTLSGNLVISGTSFTPSTNTILLGNSTQRWVLSANTGSFSGAVSGITTLAAGNTTITGFANVSANMQVTGTLSANNPIINNLRIGYNTTATAAGTTTLTSTSNYLQFFTGTTTQIVSLPAPQTMTLGMGFLIVNNSTGNLEVRAANSATVATILPGMAMLFVSIDLTAGNGAAGWSAEIVGFSTATGTGSVVLSDSPTFTGTVAAANVNSTGVVNATSYNVGTSFTANSTVVNAVSYYAGTLLVANSTVSNATHLGGVAAASYVNTSGNYTLGGRLSFTAGANAILLTNSTSNWIYWADAGFEVPTFTTRSTGTKLVLYPALSGSQTDYAIGIDGGVLWSSVPVSNSTYSFKWYGGATEIASLSGAGNLLLSGSVNAASYRVGSVFIANSTQLTTTVPFSANGGTGTAGQVLTSNGSTGSPYWSTVTGGGGVNTAASYTWTNTQIFTANVTVNAAIIAGGTSGTAGQLLASNGAGNVYWTDAPVSNAVYVKGGAAPIGTLAEGGSNIFRVNANTLNYNTTFVAGENAQATGPITVASGITLAVEAGARVSIV